MVRFTASSNPNTPLHGSQHANTSTTPNINGTPKSHHIHFIWPSYDAVTYERFLGRGVMVASLDGKDVHSFEPGALLRTAAFLQDRQVYRRCSQYEYKGCCDNGSRCTYVHAVSIDTSLTARKRAHHRNNNLTVDTPLIQFEQSLVATPGLGSPGAFESPAIGAMSFTGLGPALSTLPRAALQSMYIANDRAPVPDTVEEPQPSPVSDVASPPAVETPGASSPSGRKFYYNPYAALGHGGSQVFVA